MLKNPFASDHWLAALAWATVFYTTVDSWIDWHVVMAKRPYDIGQLVDRFRIYSDISIAAVYAYLLFTIEPLIGNPNATLFYHLIGYPLAFVLYLTSGFLRQWTYGRDASKTQPLVIGFVAYTGLLICYNVLLSFRIFDVAYLNAIALGVAFLLMFGYRWYRRWLDKSDKKGVTRP